MPDSPHFRRLSATHVARLPGVPRPKRHATAFPREERSASEIKSRLKKLHEERKEPAPEKIVERPIKAVPLTRSRVERLRLVRESDAPLASIVSGRRKLGPDGVLQTLYSSLVAYDYLQLQGEKKKRMKAAGSRNEKEKVEKEWGKIVQGASRAYGAAGLTGVEERDLEKFSRILRADDDSFHALVDIANSGQDVARSDTTDLTANTRILGGYETAHASWIEPLDSAITLIPNLCDDPLVEGTVTRHVSRSFDLRVRLRVWCPTWTNPFRTCVRSFTLAGVSFSMSLDIDYRVNCCGAVVSGQAGAQACGTVVGQTVCAQCTAQVTGVAGLGRTGSGSSCAYGLGVQAELRCSLAGITVFQGSVTLGWTVNGPCPPTRLCGTEDRVIRDLLAAA